MDDKFTKEQSASPPSSSAAARTSRRRPIGRVANPGLLLGVQATEPRFPFGFAPPRVTDKVRAGRIVRSHAPAHALTVAATGSGKGRDVIIPNVLMHDGLLICVDAGEVTRVCARRRREIGDEVVIIDPFGHVGPQTHALNPIEIIDVCGDLHAQDMAETIAWDLSRGHPTNDAFWTNTGCSLCSGCIAHAASLADPSARTLVTAASMLEGEDPVYRIAQGLDRKEIHDPFAAARFAEFLELPDGNNGATRSCVLATARQYFGFMRSEGIRRALGASNFKFADLIEGERPLSMFLVFPPTRARSHAGLLRLWISTIFALMAARTHMPSKRTLLLIDECAQVGRLEQLSTMYSYLRGTGTTIWTFWQSLGQIMDLYPNEWRTIIENSDIQAFGLHATAVEAMANLIGIPASTLRGLAPDQQVLARADRPPEIVGRLNYMTHRLFHGLADENPRYTRTRSTDVQGPEL
ncbi:MAG: type IV secretory system conjugative DNA transfer family protein [Planctomycetota bacterium]|nr:type IV secretory system conjugative DNA transfer family protein [Planctomycetota bacterium]